MRELKLADLGEGMHEAEIVEWLVKEGDTVKLDQPVVRVETDKAIVEIPSPVAGRISDVRFQVGQTAKVGEVLVLYDVPQTHNGEHARPVPQTHNGEHARPVPQTHNGEHARPVPQTHNGEHARPTPTPMAEHRRYTLRDEDARSGEFPSGAKPTHSASLPGAESLAVSAFSPTNGASSSASTVNGTAGAKKRVLAAPAVRKLAFELGIDLAEITPSANGRVTIEDVHNHVAHAATSPANGASKAEDQHVRPPELEATLAHPLDAARSRETISVPAEDRRVSLTGLRKRIAEHMERSWRTIPHATAFDEVDASELVALRRSLLPTAEQRGMRLTYMPLLAKLLIPVLKEFPIFNASLDEEKREIIYKRSYHLGVAAASPEGLLVPVLRDADRLSMLEIAARLEKLIEGAKKRTLAPNELSGSTFTLNNVGSFGGSSGTPIINWPEVAILAVGRIEEKAVARNGALSAQMRMPLALSFDHRLIDGALAGAFLARFKELVEHPQQLLLDMI